MEGRCFLTCINLSKGWMKESVGKHSREIRKQVYLHGDIQYNGCLISQEFSKYTMFPFGGIFRKYPHGLFNLPSISACIYVCMHLSMHVCMNVYLYRI